MRWCLEHVLQQASFFCGLLLQRPLVADLLDVDGALLVETEATSVQDGSREHGIGDRGEAVGVVVGWLAEFSVDATRCLDELLDRDVAIAALAIEVAALGGRVLHAESVERPSGCTGETPE